MDPITRRRYLGLSTAALLGGHGNAEPGEVAEFMQSFDVPGLSFAIAKDGRITRQEAYGFADLETGEPLGPEHRFRVASVSKPITSTAVFLLIERGQLKLEDPVLGESGLLDIGGPEGITVHHLLTHTSGGWANDVDDPMFSKIDLDHDALIAWTLESSPTKHAPGENYDYSNFGYCLLGRVIENVSGQPYEDFVLENVLNPCGAGKMTTGKGEREVKYYMDRKPVATRMNIARMDAHGGWVGTPSDIVKFALRVDGFANPEDLLGGDSLKTMTTPTGANNGYACGWSVNDSGNYWHSGSLPGLNSLLVRTAGGTCWAACINTRSEGVGLAMDQLMWKLAG